MSSSTSDKQPPPAATAKPKAKKDADPLVGPRAGRRPWDWLFPARHANWWFRDVRRPTLVALLDETPDDVGDDRSKEMLDHAEAAVWAASDRAEAAERRAATLGGAVAIATTLTISGSALIVDQSKIPDRGWRIAFAALLLGATALFAFAAYSAFRTIVSYRRWAYPNPEKVVTWRLRTVREHRARRSAELLKDFAFNWETADHKLRSLDSAFKALNCAVLVLVALAASFVLYAAAGPERTPAPAAPATQVR